MLPLLETKEMPVPLLASVSLQLLAYPIVIQLVCAVDIPRKDFILT